MMSLIRNGRDTDRLFKRAFLRFHRLAIFNFFSKSFMYRKMTSPSYALIILLSLSIRTVFSFGFPPASPPAPMCSSCAAPPPSCCPCASAPSPCGRGCAAAARLHHFSSLRSLFWRRKRGTELKAPTRTFSSNESPCPRGDWQRHMRKAIIPTDPSVSVHAVHSSLSQLYDDPMASDEHGHSNTFLLMVTCANATAFGQNQSDGQKGTIPSGVSLISSGRNFCNVRVREAGGDHSLWCQAVAIVSAQMSPVRKFLVPQFSSPIDRKFPKFGTHSEFVKE